MSENIPYVRVPSELPNQHTILNGAPSYQDIFAVSTDISADWLETAYQNGLFPWYNDNEPVLWHSPNPRMVLSVEDFKCSLSLSKRIKQWARDPLHTTSVTLNRAFERVITACALASRDGQNGTWITPELRQAYIGMHHRHKAVSVEVWRDDELISGLYGVLIGRMFFGESMFTTVADGSKVALACWVKYLRHEGCQLIDCQQETEHLSRLGGAPIPRDRFFNESSLLMQQPALDWDKMMAQEDLLAFYMSNVSDNSDKSDGAASC